MTPRLVVEDLEKRKRIISSSHDGSHMGLNRTNDIIAGKYTGRDSLQMSRHMLVILHIANCHNYMY